MPLRESQGWQSPRCRGYEGEPTTPFKGPGTTSHRVLGMLRRKGLLTPELIKLMRSWAHAGFNVNASVRIGAFIEDQR